MAAYDPARNGYFATFQRMDSFTQDAFAQYKAEVEGGTFAPQTGWKGTQVRCRTPPATPSRPIRNRATTTHGRLERRHQAVRRDRQGGAAECPRRPHRSRRQQQGDEHPQLSHQLLERRFLRREETGGQARRVWTARAVFPLHVSRTRSIACTLQEVKGKVHTDLIILATGHANVTCVKHNVALPKNGLKAPTRPTTAGRRRASSSSPRTPAACASGYHRVGGSCVKQRVVAKCKGGYVVARGKCIKKPTVSIRAGLAPSCPMASASGSRCEAQRHDALPSRLYPHGRGQMHQAARREAAALPTRRGPGAGEVLSRRSPPKPRGAAGHRPFGWGPPGPTRPAAID